jgi:predicted metal-dependent hydrolase
LIIRNVMSITNHLQANRDALDQGRARFNEAEFFEAHEIWEDWWRMAEEGERRTIQGLIQVAVAMHHQSQGNVTGALSVMKRALGNLGNASDDFFGVDMAKLRQDVRRAVGELERGERVERFRMEWVREHRA